MDRESFVLPLSHDEVVHGKGSLLGKMPGDDWQRHATLRLLYGFQWTTPGKKLLFMGGELGTLAEWNHDGVLDWSLASTPLGGGLARWLRDLNAAYRALPALHVKDCAPGAIDWLVADDREHSTLVYLRLGTHRDAPVVAAFNFTPVARYGVRLGVPRAGRWREVLCSDAAIYGGSGVGNLGGVDAADEPWQGRAASMSIAIPPLGCVVLAWEPTS
jgi:1,4-alpha-glucan branching enzyme